MTSAAPVRPAARRPVVRHALVAAIAAGAAALAPAPAAAQQTADAFEWAGRVEAGRVVHVRNMNGAVRVERGGGEVEITARKRWRRGDPERVRIEMQREGGDVVVCALWDDGGRCQADGYRARSRSDRRRGDDGDVSVEFTVRVPEGVRLDLQTVNGALEIEGATATVRARTTNGSIRAASLGGPVTARTVNGSITVSMGHMGSADLSYETVNGSVTLELPADVNAELHASTVNGGIQSDFPLTVQGRVNPRRVNARLGSGGPRLEVKTVNGGVRLRRGS